MRPLTSFRCRLLAPLFIVLILSMVSACVSGSGRVTVGDRHGSISVAFSDQDRWLIHDYYRRALPPGLAKRATLPPGLQRQVALRGYLPPQASTQHLPRELESRLSALPGGYIRLRIGTDVVLMNSDTRLILDIVKEIGR